MDCGVEGQIFEAPINRAWRSYPHALSLAPGNFSGQQATNIDAWGTAPGSKTLRSLTICSYYTKRKVFSNILRDVSEFQVIQRVEKIRATLGLVPESAVDTTN